MSGKVCVFGSFNFDMVARVERFPVPGESLVACGSMTSAGGKGANQATAALKAGANVHYIGKIGNDTFGHFARRHLKGVGFNAVTLLVAEDVPTGNALIYVAGNDAENMIAVDPGANMTVTDDEIAGCIPAIGCADVVLVQLENKKRSGRVDLCSPATSRAPKRCFRRRSRSCRKTCSTALPSLKQSSRSWGLLITESLTIGTPNRLAPSFLLRPS